MSQTLVPPSTRATTGAPSPDSEPPAGLPTTAPDGSHGPDGAPSGGSEPSTGGGLLGKVTGSLVAKLVAMVLLIVVPWAATMLVNLSGTRELGATVDRIGARNVENMLNVITVIRRTGDVARTTRTHLLSTDPADFDNAEAVVADASDRLDEVFALQKEAYAENADRLALVEDIESKLFATIDTIQQDVFPLSREDGPAAWALFNEPGGPRDVLGTVQDDITELRDLERAVVQERVDEAGARVDSQAARTLTILVALAVASVVGGAWFARKLSRPVSEAADVMELAAVGDLTVRADVTTGDEVGQMATSLNTLLDKQQHALRDISTNATELTAAGARLSDVADSLERDAENATEQVANVSTSSTEANDNTGTAAAAAQELTSSIGEIARNVSLSAEISQTADELATRATEQMRQLEAASNEVGDVIDMISSIAEQTDLLALNATIEAARAGELGKGFAVVANEVKELSTESANAATDVRQRVQSMQQQASEAITAIDEVSETITRINETSQTISAAVQEQEAATNEIARAVGTASRSTESIQSAVVEVSEAAESTNESAAQAKQSSEELAGMAGQLRSLVERYRV